MKQSELKKILEAVDALGESECQALYLALSKRMAENGWQKRGYWTTGTSRLTRYLRRFERDGNGWRLVESKKLE
jgi:thymidylate synthase